MPEDVLYLAFRGRELLVRHEDGRARVPDAAAWRSLDLAPLRENPLGAAVAVELPDGAEPPAGMAFENLRRLHSVLDEAALRLAVRAVQIVEWDRGNQFCPRCAKPVERVPGEFAKHCPPCKSSAYPRLSPAVIVLVERGSTVLLARNARFPGPMYSTLAGFVEPGETLEQTIHREIREEAGIEVRDPRYFGSQPWPFPDSLMIAFTAQYAGGELHLDPAELSDARWFEVGELPMVPPRISIARALIDAWVLRRGGDPDALKSIA
ncbi:MAG TPA: NAD(+) diphosphatase [Kofleriaceae bacterium]|nr:NAD(+) diphosphatase [Kofleriaceae bacterium]